MQLFNTQPRTQFSPPPSSGSTQTQSAVQISAAENSATAFSSFTDEKLYTLCQLYGERARHFRQKFTGLLPEVFKRRLYEKKGFGSIFEFAAKLAGISEEQVRRVLNLEKKFVATPVLKTMLEHGEVSVNKLAKIASIATPENQEILANQVKLLPCRALETLARDVHVNTNLQQNLQNATHVFGTISDSAASHNQIFGKSSPAILNLSPEVQQKLLELQQKGIDINSLLLKFLDERELKIAQEKEKLSAEAKPTQSRYIPVATKKLLKQEHGEKCSIKTCARLSETIHHSQRFALSKTHDPKYLAPLCKNHHKIAHSIDVKFYESTRQNSRN